MEKRKSDMFEELNWLLFTSNIEIEQAISEYLKEKNIKANVWELASEFIDRNELYDIDYYVDGELVDRSEWF